MEKPKYPVPIRLIPFPAERDLGNGWYRREWRVRGGDVKDFEPPPAGTLELASLVVAIVPTAEVLVVRVDSSRSDDPHDLAYASLVIQRLVKANRDECEIDGHRRHPMLHLAREAKPIT